MIINAGPLKVTFNIGSQSATLEIKWDRFIRVLLMKVWKYSNKARYRTRIFRITDYLSYGWGEYVLKEFERCWNCPL